MKNLMDYMRQIVDIFRAANARYVEKVEQLEEIDAERATVHSNKNLTEEGQRQRWGALGDQIAAIREQLDEIREQAERDAQEIRNDVERDFAGLYQVSPDQVDAQGLELLKSGILKDSELIGLSQRYSTNATMLRLVGKFAGERPGQEMQVLAARCASATNTPHLNAVDDLIRVCRYAVGGAPLSGDRGARDMGRRLNEITAPAFASAPKISWGVAGGAKYYRTEE